MNNSKIRFVGLVGIVAGFYCVSAVLASILLAGQSFSWSRNSLSDLGISPVANAANVFNYSLILAGVLNFIFAIGFVKAYAKNSSFYLGGILLILGGGSLSLVGAFTKATGALHDYVSFGYFVLFPVAMMLVGVAFTRMKMQVKGYPSILAGIIALLIILGALVLRWHRWLGLGFAVPEIIEAVIIAAWIVWMATSLALTNSKIKKTQNCN